MIIFRKLFGTHKARDYPVNLPVHHFVIDIDATASEEFLMQQIECCIRDENYERAAQLKRAIKRRFNNEQD